MIDVVYDYFLLSVFLRVYIKTDPGIAQFSPSLCAYNPCCYQKYFAKRHPSSIEEISGHGRQFITFYRDI